ncbi:FG-GAP-like repeat-containing protein [Actinoplanes sp. DH11]|uniref:FG-GAP-like repeat-containing protein n=1 Tax=Actinoplanes sp. DH11 TaxID=2857011 RepID=UPI001E5D0E46|nr:FG-GAP-like repeat-containing protein [Actinoplanes sp. DH11]
MTSTLFRTATSALAGLTAAIALGVPAQATAGKDVATPQPRAASAAVSPGTVISRTEVISRAQTWVAAQVPYSMDAYYGGYRTDCSGFISMALKTSGSYWTGNLHEIGTPIAFNGLKPGDFLNYHNPANPNNGSHVVLFDRWVGAVGGDFWIYEQTPPRAVHRKWSQTSNRVLSNYKPMRYVKIQDSAAGGVAAGDVTGDGFADVLGRRADGSLALYPNGGAGASTPYGPNSQIGSGWQSMTTFRVADVTGDGKGDVLAVRNDGALLLYAHGGDNAAPYGTARQVGTGWAGFRQVTAGDVTGDGKADVVAAAGDGALLLYAHGGDNAAPYSTGRQIGTGWAFTHLSAADANADGRADLFTVSADGQLRLYSHTGNVNAPYSTGAVIGSAWQQFDRVHAADVTGDQHADLLATKPDGTLWLYTHTRDNTAPYSTGRQIGSGWTSIA